LTSEVSTVSELEHLCERELEAADSAETLQQRIAHLERAFRLAQRAVNLRRHTPIPFARPKPFKAPGG
jgi:hypothetical protein